jgi:hypothetical protein
MSDPNKTQFGLHEVNSIIALEKEKKGSLY